MTLQFLSSKRIQGDENDTKPLNVPDGTIYYELATGGTITKFVLQAGIYEELATG
jgi:hypothetical protein